MSAVGNGQRMPWFVGALIVMLAAWVQFTTARETHVPVFGPDAGSYISYAYNLREFGVYSRERTWQRPIPTRPQADAISTPGYPMFLIPFLGERPDLDFLARVVRVQALFGTLTVLAVFLLGLRVGGVGVGTAAGVLSAVTPHLATINTYVLTESPFAFLLSLSLLALVWALQEGRRWRWGVVGLVFGACCVVRPTLQALVPIAALAALLLPGRRTHLRSPAWTALLVWMVLMAPWFAYKHSLPPNPDQPDLFRATLYHGSFPDFRYGDVPSDTGTPYRDDPYQKESMASTAGFLQHLGERVDADPMRYLRWYLIGKPATFLAWDNALGGDRDAFIYYVDASPWFNRTGFRVLHALMYGLHAPLMVAGLLAALMGAIRPHWFRARGGAKPLQALSGVALAAVLFHVVGAPYPRYGIPFWPLLYVLGATFVATVWAHLMAKHRIAKCSEA